MAKQRSEISPTELGERLRAARRATGATQEEVAEQLGLARTTLVAIEAGQRRVSDHELIALARVYGCSVSALVQPRVIPAAPQFRAPLAHLDPRLEGAAARAREELDNLASDYRALEALTGAPSAAALPPEYAAGAQGLELAAEAAASGERNRLGIGDGPIGGLRRRLEYDAAVRVFAFPMASELAGLFAYGDEAGACVGINSKHPPERQNWTLAHEYGHLLFTRHQGEITLLRAAGRRNGGERLAEAFARNFLMPAAGINRRVVELQAAGVRILTLADVVQLAHLYHVSVQAMVLRLEDLEHVRDGTWDRLMSQGFQARKAQQMLDLPALSPDGTALPERYLRLAVLAYQQAAISEGQLARFLRTDRVGARAAVAAAEGLIRAEEAAGTFPALRLTLDQPLGRGPQGGDAR